MKCMELLWIQLAIIFFLADQVMNTLIVPPIHQVLFQVVTHGLAIWLQWIHRYIQNTMKYIGFFYYIFVPFSFSQGNTLMEGVYGAQDANNAGEYLSVDMNSGVVMIYTDSDSINGGFGFLQLSPV